MNFGGVDAVGKVGGEGRFIEIDVIINLVLASQKKLFNLWVKILIFLKE